jgi:hypothetical protein
MVKKLWLGFCILCLGMLFVVALPGCDKPRPLPKWYPGDVVRLKLNGNTVEVVGINCMYECLYIVANKRYTFMATEAELENLQ